MNNTTHVTQVAARPVAKIYQFPRRAVAAVTAVSPLAMASCPWESGWYHKEAINEERLTPETGPAA